jgi:hypothetical protein
MNEDPVIPPPNEDDDDDVAWALQTAAVQWDRGAFSEAVVWLRRAVDAAINVGSADRIKELNRLTAVVGERAKAVEAESAGDPDETSESEIEEFEEIDVVDDVDDVEEPTAPADPSEAGVRGEDVKRAGAFPPPRGPSLRPPPPPRAREGAASLAPSPPAESVDTTGPGASAPAGASDSDEGALPRTPDLPLEEPLPAAPHGAEAEAILRSLLSSEPPPPLAEEEDVPLDMLPPAAAPEPLPDVVPEEAAPPSVHLDFDDDDGEEDARTPVQEPASERAPSGEIEEPEAGAQDADALGVREDAGVDEVAAPAIEAPEPPAEPASDAQAPFEDLASFAAEIGADSDAPEALFAKPVRPSQLPPPEALRAEGGAVVDGVSLENVRGFEDLPEDAQEELARVATLEHLSVDEEVGAFGAALVTRGAVGIMPIMADIAGGVARAGDVVFTRGSLEDGVSLRVVALEDGTAVAAWKPEVLDEAFADCPWVADELREVADRFQALAGATLGELGERLDDSLRDIVMDRLVVRALGPGEVLVEEGATVPGLHVVGAGRVELAHGDQVADALGSGDIVFATEVLAAGAAPATAKAGSGGALVLFASRSTAHELMLSVPPLLEILAG